MERDPQIKRAQSLIIDLTDELLEGDLTPQDGFFICKLLEHHYAAEGDKERGSKTTAEIAWEFAQQITEHVDDQDTDFSWLHAHFVISSFHTTTQRQYLDYDAYHPSTSTPVDDRSHASTFTGDTDSITPLEHATDEFTDLVELHVDVDEETDVHFSRSDSLALLFMNLSKRYARHFPYDMLESAVSFEFVPQLTEYEQDDDVTAYELTDALRLVKEWTGLRARREYQMLTVTA